MKKYEFTGETKLVDTSRGTITLHRIKAKIAFGIAKVDDLGGWIEKEENLSHEKNAWVGGDAQVYGDAWVGGNAQVGGDAQVYGDAWVGGNARVYGDARVFSSSHLLVIGPIGSRSAFTTFFRNKNREISVKCGCFLGLIDAFLQKVSKTHDESKYALVYRAAVEVAKAHIDLTGGDDDA
ncbi:MAG: hypothetical protein LBM60_07775 [Clostridium sp.]|jgi:hypothetical protein|nr:hypothetical protein [Clostridium sp.]